MGRPATASAQPTDPFAVDEDRALAELKLAWYRRRLPRFHCRGRQLGRDQQRRGGIDRRHAGRAESRDPRALAGAARMSEGKDWPDLHMVDSRADPMLRRQRFEQVHPEAVILAPSAGRWRAIVPPGLIPGDGTRTTLGAWNLGELMDQLDAIYPDSGKGHDRVIQDGHQSAASQSASRSMARWRIRGDGVISGLGGCRIAPLDALDQAGNAWPRSP